jgi:hypothetical protein
MHKLNRQLLICLAVCASSALTMLAGCGTPTHKDVGAVVVAPKPQLPPPPDLVLMTEPMPVGYFQQSLVAYFSDWPLKLMPSTPPTPAAEPTPSK